MIMAWTWKLVRNGKQNCKDLLMGQMWGMKDRIGSGITSIFGLGNWKGKVAVY